MVSGEGERGGEPYNDRRVFFFFDVKPLPPLFPLRSVAIPQAATPALEARACASSRACAQVFPCAARDDGLLWVWGTPGDAATADATPTGGHALLDRPDELVFITPW